MSIDEHQLDESDEAPPSPNSRSATFVICHGAWSGGWVWRKVRPLLRARGHEVFTPTYTGLGERFHQTSKNVDLEVHIADIVGVLEAEDLHDIVLVAHSYGGMVATGVADRCGPRIRQLIFVDAFVPSSGQAVSDLTSSVRWWRTSINVNSYVLPDWLITPPPIRAMTSPANIVWLQSLRRPQPKRTFTQPLTLHNGPLTLPRSYIYCTRKHHEDVFAQYRALRDDPDWRYVEIHTGHNPHISAPETLVQTLEALLI